MDETYIKIKGQWKYLYRAVDAAGHTIDFLLTAKRDAAANKIHNNAYQSKRPAKHLWYLCGRNKKSIFPTRLYAHRQPSVHGDHISIQIFLG